MNAHAAPGGPEVVAADDKTFDALVFSAKDELEVVDFWGPNCPNCDAFAAVFPELRSELTGQPVRFVTLNAYEHQAVAQRFGLHGIPTFLLVRGGKIFGRMTSDRGREFFLSVIRDALAGQKAVFSHE